MENILNVALATDATRVLKPLTDSPENLKQLTEFASKNIPEIFSFAGTAFIIGLGVILVSILVSYGIFKALSVFQNLINL
ncbi:MAG: hypothetical protein ACLTL2_20055 [Blautia sp.]|uniref:hypothetical protein n=1 Tax=Blautia sp. TaxID=1955243 RepID=UPI003994AA4A